jgi:hypothetical protein
MATVLILNDDAALNLRYRKALMSALIQEGHSVQSSGIFLAGRPDLATLARLVFRWRAPVVSSNLRANLVAMAAFWTSGLVILNGMGRFRKRPALRRLLLVLAKVNLRKAIAFQSYADYRYFHRFGGPKRKYWVAGSGGTARIIGPVGQLVAVQRNDKLSLVAKSLADLRHAWPTQSMLTIVGCTADASKGELAGLAGVTFAGTLPQEQIFSHGDTFVQPQGYGEGIPHTLVDALCSGMTVLIPNAEYLRCGLHRLGTQKSPTVLGWLRISPDPAVAKLVATEQVTANYMNLLRPKLF